MKKIVILILMVSVFNSCTVSIFGKLNYLGISEDHIILSLNFTEMTIDGDIRTLQANEYHEYADVNTTIVVDLDSITTSLISGGSSSIPEDWSLLPSPEEQSGLPIYSLLQLLGIISYQDLNFIGNSSFDGSFEGVSYTLNTNSLSVDSMTFPTGPALINQQENDSFSISMLDSGVGELIQINFELNSENAYIDGSGVMLISSGYPNGLLYLMYDHSTDYTSVVSQEYGYTLEPENSGLFFEAPYYGSYYWHTIRDGYEF